MSTSTLPDPRDSAIEYPDIEASAQTEASVDDEVWRLIEAEARDGAPKSSRSPAPTELARSEEAEPAYTYKMVRQGPDVPNVEVETSAAAIEVVVRWGDATLHVAHLSPLRSFFIGESGADYDVPSSALGAERIAIVEVEGRTIAAVAPPRGTAEIYAGDDPIDLLDHDERRALGPGERAIIHVSNGLRFEVSRVKAGRVVAGHISVRPIVVLYFALSALVHGSLLAAMFFLMPPLVRTEDNLMTSDQQAMLREMVKAYAEREEPPPKVEKLERKAVEDAPAPPPKAPPPPKKDVQPVALPQRKSMPEDIYRDFVSPVPNAAPAPTSTEGGGNDLYDDPGSDFGSPGGSPTGTGTGTGSPGGTGTGTGAPVVAASKPDLSKPASVVGTAWNCPFPAEADADGVDSAVATIVVTVGNDGSPRSVSVVSDPGSGFGRAARQCALGRRYVAGLDRDGNATTATTPPIRVRFSR